MKILLKKIFKKINEMKIEIENNKIHNSNFYSSFEYSSEEEKFLFNNKKEENIKKENEKLNPKVITSIIQKTVKFEFENPY